MKLPTLTVVLKSNILRPMNYLLYGVKIPTTIVDERVEN